MSDFRHDNTNLTGRRLFDGTLKVLAVGNSFSVNTMQYLYQIAQAAGVRQIVLGDLYIGGCSIRRHLDNVGSSEQAYEYYKNTAGTWTMRPASLAEGVTDEDWDVITLQQCSPDSGLPETYGADFLSMTEHLRRMRTKKDGLLAWHMTWAFARNADHPAFGRYGCDQMRMYAAICEAVRDQVLSSGLYDILIPCGTSLQNLRGTFVGDTLNADGYHLNTLGCFAAGHMWLRALTGLPLAGTPFHPEGLDVSPALSQAIVRSVEDAAASPLAVTA